MNYTKGTADAIRALEQKAVDMGESYSELMRRAGHAAAKWLREQSMVAPTSVTIVCGKGNNGGDGFVMARRLLDVVDVTVVLAEGEPATEDAAANWKRLQKQAGNTGTKYTLMLLDWSKDAEAAAECIRMTSVLVDAVYGIGFHGKFAEPVRGLMDCMNDSHAFKVALDMPSGVLTDSGKTVGGVFRADYTLTFSAKKRGSVCPACGTVVVLNIGIPRSLTEQYAGSGKITESFVKSCLKARKPDSHKGDYGRLLAVCGSYGMAGAALLCAKAALRCGTGLVTVAVPRSVYPLLAAAVPEAVFLPLPETADGQLAPEATDALLAAVDKATAVVMGPGLGSGAQLTDIVMAVLKHATCPVILDADGINAIKPHMLVEGTIAAPLVLTPHPGEMARLLDTTVEAVQAQRETTAGDFADKHGVVLALKGHGTLVAAPGGRMLRCGAGNPGMATGGSGDVLAGMIGAFAAQGMEAYEAALCGVYFHGVAGDDAAAAMSQRYMLPTDIIWCLSDRFLDLEE